MTIKNCPECGKEPRMISDGRLWMVKCNTLDCDRGCYTEPTEAEAIRKWNNRPKRRGSLAARKSAAAMGRYHSLPEGHPGRRAELDDWRRMRLRSRRKPIDTRSD